jgi:hypothetical protein
MRFFSSLLVLLDRLSAEQLANQVKWLDVALERNK